MKPFTTNAARGHAFVNPFQSSLWPWRASKLCLILRQVSHPNVHLTLLATGVEGDGHGDRGRAQDHLGGRGLPPHNATQHCRDFGTRHAQLRRSCPKTVLWQEWRSSAYLGHKENATAKQPLDRHTGLTGDVQDKDGRLGRHTVKLLELAANFTEDLFQHAEAVFLFVGLEGLHQFVHSRFDLALV